MITNKLANDVFAVSVLNPNMRTFDIVMKTDNGTSYNSYIVKGDQKTALIETAHVDFFDNLLDNIKNVAELTSIEYLIMNHNEPDHSGSIAKIIDLIPTLKIVTTKAGALFIKNIANRDDLNIIIAKDGDEIDLGGKKLRFIIAPFLHWSDSMFTYLVEDEILFSCDFLGAHYCEPQIFDKNISCKCAYNRAVENYFDAIFSPFKPYVLSGLEKIKDLPIQMAAPSHGPILTKNCQLENVINSYSEWAKPHKNEVITIPIFFTSAYGNTKLLAQNIAIGIQSVLENANVKTYDLIENDFAPMAKKLNESDAFLIGTPTINRDALPPLLNLLSMVDAINIAKRPCAAFGSYGWSGEGVPNIKARLTNLKTNLFEEDFRVIFVPTQKDLEDAKAFGVCFAKEFFSEK